MRLPQDGDAQCFRRMEAHVLIGTNGWKLLNANTGKTVLEAASRSQSDAAAFSRDGKWLALTTEYNRSRFAVYEISTGKELFFREERASVLAFDLG